MESLFTANQHFLNQAAELIDQLDDSLYSKSNTPLYGSSIGAHLRHCLDHYEAFIAGFDGNVIDYDSRKRDNQLEVCTQTAYARVENLTEALGNLSSKAESSTPSLKVKMDCGVEDRWEPSSVGRELQFLVSHTVHHFAMISTICTIEGVETPENFGLAPSTIKYRAANA